MVNRNLFVIPAVSLSCHDKDPAERENSDATHKLGGVPHQQNTQEGTERTGRLMSGRSTK
jgi:hypothetical protein